VMIFKPLLMMDRKPSGISVMLLIRMLRSGTTTVDMKSHKVSLRPTLWKQIMQNCAITWLAWQDHRDVSLVARMHFIVLFAYSFTATIIVSSKAVSFLTNLSSG
jgi:tRNA U34 5-methylaminomethyl-2-thiouridine-forming methyltransferase MnmC